jgi:hypothetical protein
VGISAALRDIVVEILFRDIEYLLDKYMTDMRKVYMRIYVSVCMCALDAGTSSDSSGGRRLLCRTDCPSC